MKNKMNSFVMMVLTIMSLSGLILAQDSLVIGTKEAPPFAIKNEDGSWSGLSIDLLDEMMKEGNFTYTLREFPNIESLIQDTKNGKLDAAISAISITADREKLLDFSHPYYTTGLGIAVKITQGNSLTRGIFNALFSKAFFSALSALGLVLLLAGLAVWFLERKKNPDQFGGSTLQGIGSGFWWSAVTMTTVGYGDKSPVTIGGRIIGLVWMFASIIIISGFTAAIASSLTVEQLGSSIKGPDDLPGKKVATTKGSSAEDYLNQVGIKSLPYATAGAAMKSLKEGKIDAFVHDAPLLKYLSLNEGEGKVMVLPQNFVRQDYGIALPYQSGRRENFNSKILEIISGPKWKEIKSRYLGKSN